MTSRRPPDDTTAFFQRLTAFETTLIAGGFILFLVLLYEMEGFLNPPLLAIATLILLWPVRRHRTVRALLLSGAFLMTVWLLDELSGILVPFVVVYLLAYLFDPVVVYLQERYGIARWISSLLVTLVLVGLVVLFVFLIVPNIVSQFEILARRIVDSIQLLRDWLTTTTVLDNLERRGLVDKEELIRQTSTLMQEQATALATGIPNAAQEIVGSLGSLLGVITTISIIPVVLFYTLKDYPFIKQRLVELFPTFGGRRDYLVHAGGIVGNYLRGQLTISAISAFNVSVVLLLFNVPFALLLGILSGILNMVPNLGIIITNVVGLLIAFIFGDPWYLDLIIIAATLMGQSLLETAVLTPNILSYQVGLHPVLIILSLFVFGFLMGIFGLLIAVPATALLMTVYKTYREELTLELARPDARDSAAREVSEELTDYLEPTDPEAEDGPDDDRS